MALQTQIKRDYKEKWPHNTIVKFKSLDVLDLAIVPSNTIFLTFLLSILVDIATYVNGMNSLNTR